MTELNELKQKVSELQEFLKNHQFADNSGGEYSDACICGCGRSSDYLDVDKEFYGDCKVAELLKQI